MHLAKEVTRQKSDCRSISAASFALRGSNNRMLKASSSQLEGRSHFCNMTFYF